MDEVKEFLQQEEIKELLRQNNLEEVYERYSIDTNELTDFFLKSGIQPLDYFVTSVPSNSYYMISCPNLKLKDSIKYIGSEAFLGSDIQTITFSKNLELIKAQAFACNFKLKEVDLSILNNLMEIGGYAFDSTDIHEVELPTSIVSLNSRAFGPKALVKIPESRKEIIFKNFRGYEPIFDIEWI